MSSSEHEPSNLEVEKSETTQFLDDIDLTDSDRETAETRAELNKSMQVSTNEQPSPLAEAARLGLDPEEYQEG